jgi:hypothetical protein
MPGMSTVLESVKTGAIVSPTDSEIATAAYQLWLAKGCPLESDQEDWYRAEAMLKSAAVVKCEDLFRSPLMTSCDTRTESEMVGEFPWDGHWEVWERECVTASWVWDVRASRVEATNRACPAGKAA